MLFRSVKGFSPIMPTFQGQVNEDDLIKLLAYVKSLGAERKFTPEVQTQQKVQDHSGSPLNPGALPNEGKP